jgi:hypothetical protein
VRTLRSILQILYYRKLDSLTGQQGLVLLIAFIGVIILFYWIVAKWLGLPFSITG